MRFWAFILLCVLLVSATVEGKKKKKNKGCKRKMDIVIMVDSSTSIGQEKFEKSQSKVRQFIKSIASKKVRIAVGEFNTAASIKTDLEKSKRRSVKKAVKSLDFFGGNTNIAGAINAAYGVLASQGKDSAKKVIVIVSDGEANYGGTVKAAKKALKGKGVKVKIVSPRKLKKLKKKLCKRK